MTEGSIAVVRTVQTTTAAHPSFVYSAQWSFPVTALTAQMAQTVKLSLVSTYRQVFHPNTYIEDVSGEVEINLCIDKSMPVMHHRHIFCKFFCPFN